MSNIPAPDIPRFNDEIRKWDIIDRRFFSSSIKQRKPDVAFYTAFLKYFRLRPKSCILVDKRVENVITAQSLGFRRVLHKDRHSLITTLHKLFGDPVIRAQEFLKQNAKRLFCETSTGQEQRDNYSQLLILQNTGDRCLF